VPADARPAGMIGSGARAGCPQRRGLIVLTEVRKAALAEVRRLTAVQPPLRQLGYSVLTRQMCVLIVSRGQRRPQAEGRD
jgi:hypothetical protein